MKRAFEKLALSLAIGVTLVGGSAVLNGCRSNEAKARDEAGLDNRDAEQRTKDFGKRAGGTIERGTGHVVEGAGTAVDSDSAKSKGQEMQKNGQDTRRSGQGE